MRDEPPPTIVQERFSISAPSLPFSTASGRRVPRMQKGARSMVRRGWSGEGGDLEVNGQERVVISRLSQSAATSILSNMAA